MYHTERNPYTGEKLFVEKTAAGKLKQRYALDANQDEGWEEAGDYERKRQPGKHIKGLNSTTKCNTGNFEG
jgi:hypothetical protein